MGRGKHITLVNKEDLGFGQRSWRYSMLVKDGVIEKMFIEPEVEGDPFEVSDADTMLSYINPEAEAPRFATVLTREGCSYCRRARQLLNAHGVEFEELELNKEISFRSLRALTGVTSVPQIFIGGKRIEGAEQLALHLSSELGNKRLRVAS